MHVVFPQFEEELVSLGEQDQLEIRGHYQKLKQLDSEEKKQQLEIQFKEHCHQRAERMMEILHEIKEPSISNIGIRGSEIVSLLALHSYLDEMKEVLAAYLAVYKRNRQDVYNESIPSLTDRVMVFEERRQLYGNNWMVDKHGKFFLIPVEDFEHMNDRRAQFGLGPRMKPIVYAIGENKYPLGKGMAEASDQKELTDEEYAEFTKGHLR
jgi:hypothetical protein